MKDAPSGTEKIFLAIGTILVWFAVAFQFYLIILNRADSVAATTIRFFSYFTILTNLMLALCFSFLFLKPASEWGNFFGRTSTLTALAVYITVVGITYNAILRFQWSPQGLQRVVDELLHLVNPLFFLLFWFLFARRQALKWNMVLPWAIYPAAYCIYVIIRGAISGEYPYPFMDVGKLGYPSVLINCGGVLVLFLTLSFLFVGITKNGKTGRGINN